MKFKLYIWILVLIVSNFQIASGAENEYGTVRASFNGQNATVEGIQLKIGEPVELKVEITSKIKGDVLLTLREPGSTKAYDLLTGPSTMDKRIENLGIESGWSKTYIWKFIPNGAWKKGNAPINIVAEFYKGMNDKIIQFTIANPYILDEQYTGATSSTTGAPEITDRDAQAKPAPFLPAIFVIVALIFAGRFRGR